MARLASEDHDTPVDMKVLFYVACAAAVVCKQLFQFTKGIHLASLTREFTEHRDAAITEMMTKQRAERFGRLSSILAAVLRLSAVLRYGTLAATLQKGQQLQEPIIVPTAVGACMVLMAHYIDKEAETGQPSVFLWTTILNTCFALRLSFSSVDVFALLMNYMGRFSMVFISSPKQFVLFNSFTMLGRILHLALSSEQDNAVALMAAEIIISAMLWFCMTSVIRLDVISAQHALDKDKLAHSHLAAHSILNARCDAVAELDERLQIQRPTWQVAVALGVQVEELAGRLLSTFLPSREDQERFESHCRAIAERESRPQVSSMASKLHVTIRPGAGSDFSGRLFHVAQPATSTLPARHLVGICCDRSNTCESALEPARPAQPENTPPQPGRGYAHVRQEPEDAEASTDPAAHAQSFSELREQAHNLPLQTAQDSACQSFARPQSSSLMNMYGFYCHVVVQSFVNIIFGTPVVLTKEERLRIFLAAVEEDFQKRSPRQPGPQPTHEHSEAAQE